MQIQCGLGVQGPSSEQLRLLHHSSEDLSSVSLGFPLCPVWELFALFLATQLKSSWVCDHLAEEGQPGHCHFFAHVAITVYVPLPAGL